MKSWQKSLIPLLALLLLAIILALLFPKGGGAQSQSPIPKPANCQRDCPQSVLDKIDCETEWCCYGLWAYPPGIIGYWSGYKWACKFHPDPFTSPIQPQSVWTLYLPLVSR